MRPASIRNAAGQSNRLIKPPKQSGVTAIPTKADPLTRPLVRDRFSGGIQLPTARASAGWRGADTIPIRPRIMSSPMNTHIDWRATRPTAPVSETNRAEPNPTTIKAARAPQRSMKSPPGIMQAVYVTKNAE